MTNAEKHVAALIAAFGEPYFWLSGPQCGVHFLIAVGNTIRAGVEIDPDHIVEWLVPDPEVLIPDPAGDIEKEYPETNDDGDLTGGTVIVRFREDPIAVATQELSSFLRAVRQ